MIKRISVILMALAMAFGAAMGTDAHHKNGHDKGVEKAYHCHALGDNGGETRYNLLHLPHAATNAGNAHGEVEVRVTEDGTVVCPDDEGYDDADALVQDGAHATALIGRI